MWRARDLHLNGMYNFFYINVYKILDNSSQLEMKHVVMNKLIKELVLFVTDLIHILVLNSWSIVLFKQLVIAQLIRKFSTFYSTQRFMTIHKSLSLPPILSWMNPVQSLSSYFLKIQFNLIVLSTSKSCKLLFHWGFPTITLYSFLFCEGQWSF